MNKIQRINLIAATFNVSDCDLCFYQTEDGDLIEIDRDEWDGGDLPFVGGSCPELYAVKHFTAGEAFTINDYRAVVARAKETEADEDYDAMDNFWNLPENEDAENAFRDAFADVPDDDVCEGEEYWVRADPDWAF